VKTHLSNVLRKLGLAHRTQAAVYALRSGLIT
jgi:DNA-binding NarL/FixJ family response regulator